MLAINSILHSHMSPLHVTHFTNEVEGTGNLRRVCKSVFTSGKLYLAEYIYLLANILGINLHQKCSL